MAFTTAQHQQHKPFTMNTQPSISASSTVSSTLVLDRTLENTNEHPAGSEWSSFGYNNSVDAHDGVKGARPRFYSWPESINNPPTGHAPVSKSDYSRKKSFLANVLLEPNQWKDDLLKPEAPTRTLPYPEPASHTIDDSLIDTQLLETDSSGREKRKLSDFEMGDTDSLLSEASEDSSSREVRRRTDVLVKEEPEDDSIHYRGSLFARRSLRNKVQSKLTSSNSLNRGRNNNSMASSAMVRCQSEPRYGRRQSKAPIRLLGRGEQRNAGLSISYLTEVPAWLQYGSAQIDDKLNAGHHGYVKRSIDSGISLQSITTFKQDPTNMEYFDFDTAGTSEQAAGSIPAYAWDARSDPGGTPTFRPGQPYYDSAYHTGTYPGTPSYTSVAPSAHHGYGTTSYGGGATSSYDYDYYRSQHPGSTQSYSMGSTYAPTPLPSASGYQFQQESAGGPYVCDFPGCQQKQQYSRMCELNKHKKTHERNFPCRHSSNCKAFSTAKDRNRHETTIHKAEFGGEEYVCQDCGKSCSRKDNLRDHRRRRHGMD